ncbi:MAG: autorepressor SdpR family transcription factor [Aquisalinus sp.]|nr:autorepressor SdpR family transcription factor [Aquisalinus sp.]
MDSTYRALSHPIRRKVLRLLRQRAHTAGELADQFDIAKPTLSGHLNVLKQAELVTVDRKGTTLTYRLNMSVAEELIENLLALLGVEATMDLQLNLSDETEMKEEKDD